MATPLSPAEAYQAGLEDSDDAAREAQVVLDAGLAAGLSEEMALVESDLQFANSRAEYKLLRIVFGQVEFPLPPEKAS